MMESAHWTSVSGTRVAEQGAWLHDIAVLAHEVCGRLQCSAMRPRLGAPIFSCLLLILTTQ